MLVVRATGARPGDRVGKGQALLTLHTDTADRIPYALRALDGSYDIAPPDTHFTAPPVVIERIA